MGTYGSEASSAIVPRRIDLRDNDPAPVFAQGSDTKTIWSDLKPAAISLEKRRLSRRSGHQPHGTGGEQSDGKAQGFQLQFPSTKYLGETTKNVGNADAGRVDLTNQGNIAGTFRDDLVRGHATGVFGGFSGLCDLVDYESGDC